MAGHELRMAAECCNEIRDSYVDVLRGLKITGYNLGMAGCTEKEVRDG